MPRTRPFCADESRGNDEPLHATASRVDHWILVEYRSLWSHDAFAGSGLTEQVKSRLRAQVKARPRTRLLFIRSRARRGAPGLLAYSASSREGEEGLRVSAFDEYRDLLDIDLAGGDGDPVGHPLLLVCTHGKHDPCCATYGRPLYDALADELEADWVWQSTHVGGDRFAGNLVCLPHGLYYGRLDRPAASAVLDELLAERVYLDPYRGRSCYPFAVQAAERAVRVDTGLLGIDDLRLLAAHRREDGAWTVAISARGRGVEEVDLREEVGELVHLTCSAEDLKRPRRYVVTGRRVRPAA
jgi:Sucrase/ferredoxin-like